MQIELDGIGKSFFVSERPEGRFSALRGAFRRIRREVRALSDISFAIGEGELVGYIGPNGAGKSTTVKVMGGILTPECGTCTVLGRVPWKERVKHVENIGVVFGQRSQLWWDVPVRDSFELLRDIYGVSAGDYAQRLCELADALDFGNLLATPVRQLSLGQRMRCEVGAALLHRPKVLFLDEPTIGLDAVSKLALREYLLKENKERGTTMILTTHDMDDIEALCSRVMTIGKGELLFDGTIEELRHRYAPLHALKARLEAPSDIRALVGAERVDAQGDSLTVWYDPNKIPTHSVIARLSEAAKLKTVDVRGQNIDEIIATMYREMAL